MVLFLIDPGKQLNKAKDAQKKEDFRNIRSALDAYYNDFNCYPVTIPFGSEWKVNSTIYMKEIPYDAGYTYVVDPNTGCSQWNVLFGRLAIAPPSALPACLLPDDCLPLNYRESGYNLCDFGGNIDCSILQSHSLPLPSPTNAPNPSPTPTNIPGVSPTSSPTPVPTISIPPDGIYYCGCGNNHVTVCNVIFSIPEGGVPYYGNASCEGQCGDPC